MKTILLLVAVVSFSVAGSAQDAVFADGFEWGDAGDWSTAEPVRCDRLEAFGRGLAPTSGIHVATSGNNSTGNGSAGNPYATISRAVQDAVPGSAIVVHEGTYSGGVYLSDLEGTASAPIWIGGASGEARPIIDGGGEGLHLTRGKYLVIHDLEVRNAADNGINTDDGGDYGNPLATHHVTFKGL